MFFKLDPTQCCITLDISPVEIRLGEYFLFKAVGGFSSKFSYGRSPETLVHDEVQYFEPYGLVLEALDTEFVSALQYNGNDTLSIYGRYAGYGFDSLDSNNDYGIIIEPSRLFSDLDDTVDFRQNILLSQPLLSTLFEAYLNGLLLFAGDGNDIVYLPNADSSTIVPENLPETLGFTYLAKFSFRAEGGDDTVYGGDIADYIRGGDGNDHLLGGAEADELFGEGGSDTLEGGAGDDSIKGGEGADKLYGDDGADRLEGGEGDDTLEGGEGDDTIIGGEHADKLYGDDGADRLEGGEGDDTLEGGEGDDTIIGGEGDDTSYGGPGSDRFLVSRKLGVNDGSNFFFGGSSAEDFDDFLDSNTQDSLEYDRPKSNFTLRSNPFGLHGVSLISKHDVTQETDIAQYVDLMRFSDNTSWSQADVIEAGWLAHLFLSLDMAFTQLEQFLPDDDTYLSPGLKKFAGWLTIGQKIAQIGADLVSTTDFKGAVQRMSVVGAREAIFPVIDQSRAWAEEFIQRLPEHWQGEVRERIDTFEEALKDRIVTESDDFGRQLSNALEPSVETLNDLARDLWERIEESVRDRHQSLSPNGSLRETADDFNIDVIEIKEDNFRNLPIIPKDSTTDSISPSSDEESIVLPPLSYLIRGKMNELDGDVIYNFTLDDKIVVADVTLSSENLTVTYGSAILDIDVDLDGAIDTRITLEGDFIGQYFSVSQAGGDTEIFLEQEPVPNVVNGSTLSDNLFGTGASDILRSFSGRYDTSLGGEGMDYFVFGSETRNGTRERDVILDYEGGLDQIVLEDDASIAHTRKTSTQIIVFFEGDGDAVYIRGDDLSIADIHIVHQNDLDFF